MSIYIDFKDGTNKYDWIVEHGVLRYRGNDKSGLSFSDIKKYDDGDNHVLVVWGKPSFEVLIVICNALELAHFDINDDIEKFWAYVPIKDVIAVSAKYRDWYYTNNVDILNNDKLRSKSTYTVCGGSDPYIVIDDIKYSVDLDFDKLGLSIDGDVIKIDTLTESSSATLLSFYAISANGERDKIYVLGELRSNTNINPVDIGNDLNIVLDNLPTNIPYTSTDSKLEDNDFNTKAVRLLYDRLYSRLGNARTPTEALKEVMGVNENLNFVGWHETKLLDAIAAVYDETEDTGCDLYAKVLNYADKYVLYSKNITNGSIKKEVLRGLMRDYKKCSNQKFNPNKIKYPTSNDMLLALYATVKSFNTDDDNFAALYNMATIEQDIQVYLNILDIKESL